MTYATGVDDAPPDLAKYAPLNTFLVTNSVTVSGRNRASRAIVLGGGKAVIEQSILRDVGFIDGEIVCIDRVPPLHSEFLGSNSIIWLEGFFPDTIEEELVPPSDCLISLGASRYFHDAFDIYLRLIRQLRPGSLVVIDFLHQPVIRRAAIEALRGWVLDSWALDRETALAGLHDLARLSLSLGASLARAEVRMESNTPALGWTPGTYQTQRVLFEAVFPFWFRSGMGVDDVLSQMLWCILCRSMDGTEERVLEFAKSSDIDVIGVLALSPDTNILIGRTSRTSASAREK